jgi:hypothetical protein
MKRSHTEINGANPSCGELGKGPPSCPVRLSRHLDCLAASWWRLPEPAFVPWLLTAKRSGDETLKAFVRPIEQSRAKMLHRKPGFTGFEIDPKQGAVTVICGASG